MSNKHKLTLYKTQNEEPNYVDHKFFFNFYWDLFLPVQNLGSWNTIELTSWLMYELCDFTLHDIKKLQCLLNTPWKYICLMPTFYLFGESPHSTFPPFHYSLGSYLYLFFVIHFTKPKLIARSFPVLKVPEKMYYSLLLGYICN